MILFFQLLFQMAFANQYKEVPFDVFSCASEQGSFRFEKQKISGNFHLFLISTNLEKEFSFSALGFLLEPKCQFYFFPYSLSTDRFHMRLDMINSRLRGPFEMSKPISMKRYINCTLVKGNIETLPSRCQAKFSPQQKVEKQIINRVLPSPTQTKGRNNSTGKGSQKSGTKN